MSVLSLYVMPFLNRLNPVGGSISMSGSVPSSRCQDAMSYHTITVIPTPSLQTVHYFFFLFERQYLIYRRQILLWGKKCCLCCFLLVLFECLLFEDLGENEDLFCGVRSCCLPFCSGLIQFMNGLWSSRFEKDRSSLWFDIWHTQYHDIWLLASSASS